LSLPRETVSGFGDELVKIGGPLSTLGKWTRRGWDDLADIGATPVKRMGGLLPPKKVQGGWMGRKGIWKHLPVGGKSLTVGAVGLMTPGVLAKQDPLGRGRSRLERGADLGGDVLGGLAGAGAALSLPGKKWMLLRSIGGGITGSLIGSRVATTPWRVSRAQAARPVLSPEERQQLMSRVR
jgi:hypothetical protein